MAGFVCIGVYQLVKRLAGSQRGYKQNQPDQQDGNERLAEPTEMFLLVSQTICNLASDTPPASNLWQRRFNYRPQQCLYFSPLPQGQRQLRPTFGPVRTALAFSATVAASIPNKKARSLSLRAFESNPV
jgi:hypothetical protein